MTRSRNERNFIFLQAGKKIRFRQATRVIGDVEAFLQVELMEPSGRTDVIYARAQQLFRKGNFFYC